MCMGKTTLKNRSPVGAEEYISQNACRIISAMGQQQMKENRGKEKFSPAKIYNAHWGWGSAKLHKGDS